MIKLISSISLALVLSLGYVQAVSVQADVTTETVSKEKKKKEKKKKCCKKDEGACCKKDKSTEKESQTEEKAE